MKNLKSVLVNAAVALVGVLFLVFMSQAYETIKVFDTQTISGYDLTKTTNFDLMDSKTKYMVVAGIFTIVFVCVLLLVSILNILTSLEVIKSEKVAKILNIVNVVASALIVVFIVSVLGIVADQLSGSPVASVGWALILNMILAVVALALTVFHLFVSLKKKNA